VQSASAGRKDFQKKSRVYDVTNIKQYNTKLDVKNTLDYSVSMTTEYLITTAQRTL